MRVIAWTGLLIACSDPVGKSEPVGSEGSTDPPAVVDTSDDLDGDTGNAPDGPAPPGSAARDLIDGVGALDAVLRSVAWEEGWPAPVGDDTYVVVAPGDGPLHVATSASDWTPWPMTQADGFRWIELVLPGDQPVAYKLVHDAGGAGERWDADPWARSYTYDGFGRLSWARPPSDAPHLERWPGLTGHGLAARDVVVWVPPGAGPWPLLVAHDGQNLFDPAAPHGGWRLGEALGALDTEVLLVGLHNTADRMSEYTHVPDTVSPLGATSPSGDAYCDLIDDTVLPWADDTWSLSGHVGILGSSLGGLISLHCAHRHPDAFDFVASLSGTLGWGRLGAAEELMQTRWTAAAVRDLVVFADSGGGPGPDATCTDPNADGSPADDPDARDNYCTTRAFVDALAASGYTWGTDLHHWWEPDASHTEAAWAARVGRPLALFVDQVP